MKFKPGQEVVCAAIGWKEVKQFVFWFIRIRTVRKTPGPKLGDIVKIDCYMDNEFMMLNGYGRAGFHENGFVPAADITELEEILKAKEHD